MSASMNPINPERFALALESLPIDALHAKAAELRNSIDHLRSSNAQMLPFADEGDQDCKEAMFENLTVIGRMNQRIGLIRQEVEEKRGLRWSEGEVEDAKVNGVRGPVDGSEDDIVVASEGSSANGGHGGSRPSGRLTDDELRRRLEEQLADDDNEADEEGVHL